MNGASFVEINRSLTQSENKYAFACYVVLLLSTFLIFLH